MPPSWREFVACHASPLARIAWRILGNEADAEEVVQELFLEIHRSGRHESVHGQPALLATMATRRSLDALRKRKPQVTLLDQDLPPDRCNPLEDAIGKETEHLLREWLRSLPPREAEVFCLQVWEGKSTLEIATQLGISAGAVAKAMCKARERLLQRWTAKPLENHP